MREMNEKMLSISELSRTWKELVGGPLGEAEVRNWKKRQCQYILNKYINER